ncbi:MAG: MFS transporter [Candidatus Omnitrophota bacterium]|jgi:MFS family permease
MISRSLFPADSPYARSLRIAWPEGIAAAVITAIADYYLIPLALMMGAVPYEIGLLVAIPHLLGSLSQLWACRMVLTLGSRRRVLVLSAASQAVFFAPLAILPFFPFSGRFAFMIALVAVYRILGNLIGTVLSSLLGDYLDENWRGKFLGWRLRIVGIAGLVTMASAGALMSHAKLQWASGAFLIVFTAASLSRAVSACYLSRVQDVPYAHPANGAAGSFSLWQFLGGFGSRNFTNFVVYAAGMMFSAMVVSPYISVYMLKELKFDYFTYITIHMAAVTSGLLVFPLWGHHADKVGNAHILKATGALIPFIPLYWMTVKTPWILFLCECCSGFIWAGFNLCAVNFIFDAVRPENRVKCLSYFNLLNGIAIFAGSSAGGFLSSHLPQWFGSRFYLLCLISFLGRLGTTLYLSGKFREVRPALPKLSNLDLFFSVLGIKPAFTEAEN